MADREQLRLLKDDLSLWNEWRRRNPSVVPELSSANLRGTDLSFADLSGARLWEADLRRTSLGRSSFARADLRDARFNEARAGHADLSGALLVGASFVDSNLGKASLKGAIVDRADFSGADLRFVRGISNWQSFLRKVRVNERTLLPDYRAPDIENLDPSEEVNWAPRVEVVDPGRLELQPDSPRLDVEEEERRQLGLLVRVLSSELNEALANSNAVGNADRRNFDRLAQQIDTAVQRGYEDDVIVINGRFKAYSALLPPDFRDADHHASELLSNLEASLRQLNLTYEVFRNYANRIAKEDFGELPSVDNVRVLEDVAAGKEAEEVLTANSHSKLQSLTDGLAESAQDKKSEAIGRVALIVGTLRNAWSAARTFIVRNLGEANKLIQQETAQFQSAPIDRLKAYSDLILSVLRIFKSFLRE